MLTPLVRRNPHVWAVFRRNGAQINVFVFAREPPLQIAQLRPTPFSLALLVYALESSLMMGIDYCQNTNLYVMTTTD